MLGYLEECDNVKKGQTLMQIGMGGGMKAGINVWRALRDNRCHHTAWAHRAGKPYTEEDLPRSIEAIDGNSHLKMAAKVRSSDETLTSTP